MVLGLCIVIAYIFVRGLLGVMYEIASWAVTKFDGPDNEENSNPPQAENK
jgi:hypothetical protein